MSSAAPSWSDHVAAFEAAMAEAGLACAEGVKADGNLHRCKMLGDSEKDGFYCLHLDEPTNGWFGHWAMHPEPIKWRPEGSKPLDREQESALKAQISAARVRRDAEVKANQASAAKSAKEQWLALGHADAEHPYLVRKGINTHGLKETDDGRLVILVSVGERAASLQYVDESGDKRFLIGGAVKGGYYRLGGKPTDVAYIAEGFATAASIREATGATVYTAFSCHNLPLVAQALHQKYPEIKIVIAADNDCETDDNPGLKYARQAAGLVDGTYIVPTLKAAPDKRCDFNDVHKAEGLDAVRALLLANQEGLTTQTLNEVEPEDVTWGWEPFFAIGKVGMLVGNPDVTKSLLSLYVAATLSTGRDWFNGKNTIGVGETLLLALEDGPADTIRPRFDALGGDATKVHLIKAVRRVVKKRMTERTFDLSLDLPLLEQTLQRNPNIRLLIVDPISAYLGGGSDSHKNAEMRALLTPLAVLAEKYHIAILAISHLNKSASQVIYRVTGSLAFVAAARTVYLVAEDPQNPERRLVLRVKNNLHKDRAGIAYSIVGDEQGRPTIAFEKEPVQTQACDALSDKPSIKADSPKLAEAKAFLKAALADGEPHLSTEVTAEAVATGIAEKTYLRARSEETRDGHVRFEPGPMKRSYLVLIPDTKVEKA
jgi:putative DNA primase/helicase